MIVRKWRSWEQREGNRMSWNDEFAKVGKDMDVVEGKNM